MHILVPKLREDYKHPHHLITTSDDQILFLRAWEPQNPSKSKIAILILHDITAHSGSYKSWGIPLSNKGYSVFGLDLRGHGLSDGIRGDYPNKERLATDLCDTISFLKKKFSKIILFGHSLGVLSSFIAIDYCIENINGLILLSMSKKTRHGVYPSISMMKKLKILFSSRISPSRPIITYKREGLIGLSDPLFNFKYTLRFLKIFSVMLLEKLNIPVLVGLGNQDELFSIEAGQQLFNEIPSENKEFIIFPNANHSEFPKDSAELLIPWIKKNFS